MLQHSDWNGPSLGGMIQWLEQQPQDQTYNYSDIRKCACAQYYDSMGKSFQEDLVLSKDLTDAHRIAHYLNYSIAAKEPHTFAGALSRARAAMAESFDSVTA